MESLLIKLKTFFDPKTPIEGKKYLAWGLVFFLIKYPLDHYVSVVLFKRTWNPLVYFSITFNPLFNEQASIAYWAGMTAIAVPFFAVAVLLTLRRIHTVNLWAGYLAFVFVPFCNVFFFLYLSFIKKNEELKDFFGKREFFDRVLPKSRLGLSALSLLLAIVLASIVYFGLMIAGRPYGSLTFVSIPVFVGFITSLIMGFRYPLTKRTAILNGILPMMLGTVFFLVVGLEGIVCVTMSAPLIALGGGAGGYIAYKVLTTQRPGGQIMASLVLMPLLFVFPSSKSELPERAVVSTIEIASDRHTVFNNVVAFPEIKTGWRGWRRFFIPALEQATITGKGEGALRECKFDRGIFKEPIKVWKPGEELTFGVIGQPAFLENVLEVTKGQFKIEKKEGKVLLIGTTWYRSDIAPSLYWNWTIDLFMHEIHMRALEHIKKISEKS